MISNEERGINPNALKLRSPFRHAANKYIPLDRKQQHMLAKEVWDTFGTLQTGVERMADYAVTGIEVILDDEEELGKFSNAKEARAAYKELYEIKLNISSVIKDIIINQKAMGSAFPYYGFEVRKKAYCPLCKERASKSKKSKAKGKAIEYNGEWLDSMDESEWKYVVESKEPAFKGTCPKCRQNVTFDVIEEREYTKNTLSVHLLDITRIDMDWIPINNKRKYWYNPDKRSKRYVSENNKWGIAHIPLAMLSAIAKDGRIELRKGTFAHICESTIAQSSLAWPMPSILRAFFELFHIASLRAASESIAATQIVPFTTIWPNDLQAFQGKPGGLAFRKFRQIIMEEHAAWAENPKHIWVSPIPITFGRQGGDGKMMLPTQELQYAWDNAFLSIGIPRGLLTGNITWAGNHIAMRIFQNSIHSSRTLIQRFIDLVQNSIQSNLTYLPKATITLKPFKELDDAWYKQLMAQLRGEGVISNQELCEILEKDPDAMREQVQKETRERAKFEAELQLESAANEAKANAKFNKVMMAEQGGQMVEQGQLQAASIVNTIKDMHTNYNIPVNEAINMFKNYQTMMMQQQEMDMMRMQQQQAQQTFLDKEMASAGQSINRAARGRSLYGMMGQDPTQPGGQPPSSSTWIEVLRTVPPEQQQAMMSTLQSIDPVLYTAVQGGLGQPNPNPAGGDNGTQN